MRICLICPVRRASAETERWIASYVETLEGQGHIVHWPQRDNPQDDETGVKICTAQLDAIKNSDVVDIIWDRQSYGSHFDLGAAFMANKPVGLIAVMGDGQLVQDRLPPPGKSYWKVILNWPWNSAEQGQDSEQSAILPCGHHADNAEWRAVCRECERED